MELWTLWTHLLQTSLNFLSGHFGLSEAVSILAFTLFARLALLPLSLKAAYRAHQNKEALERIKPTLEGLRETHKANPSELAAQTAALYREQGITFLDKVSLLNMGSQGILGLGIFQTLKRASFQSGFLWISNLAKPDLVLTLLISLLMLLGAALMPGATAHPSTLLMVLIPIVVTVFAIAVMPSALGLYWATSNAVTVAQTLALRRMLARSRPLVA